MVSRFRAENVDQARSCHLLPHFQGFSRIMLGPSGFPLNHLAHFEHVTMDPPKDNHVCM